MSELYDFSVELKFTETYQAYQTVHRAAREAQCLRVMYPALLGPIEEEDGFAGRIRMSSAGFSPEPGGLGYYCREMEIKDRLRQGEYTEEFKSEILNMLDFWKTENTEYKVRAAYSPQMAKALPSDAWMTESGAAFPLYRMGGSCLDYDKLLQSGIPGMKAMVRGRKAAALAEGGDVSLLDAMESALELLSQCCLFYSEMAEKLAVSGVKPERKKELDNMSRALANIAAEKPETLREAIQLSWLYALLSGTLNYGRMDVYLGDFLVRDLETGILKPDEAQELLNSYWRLIAARKTTWNGRVVLGGKGRRNEASANQFALLAMEATRVVREIEPQLTLRFYTGMEEALTDKALSVIAEGRTYPMLYNDDVNIPAVSQAFCIPLDEAEQYLPFGCGEYVIDHKSFGTPSGVLNNLKALEITLHNGRDPVTGRQAGLQTGDFNELTSFDSLFEAYTKQLQYLVDSLAEQEELEYRIAGESAPFLFLSMLYDDCIGRAKGIFSGGVRYLGGTLESYGNTNTADSLAAIRELVYDQRVISQEELLTALDADFQGCEKIRSRLLAAPKYGNDDPRGDEIAVRLHEQLCSMTRDQKGRVGLDSYLIVIINNSANTVMGRHTAASADGRKKGMPMANANNPSGGSDKKGLTAMLNSLVKLNPGIHAGSVQNMKLSPELFRELGKGTGSIAGKVLETYFTQGGTQAMISVVSKGDLEKALKEPEKYTHLFVRVGGFSARFVELERDVQMEILSRTQY